MPRKIFAHTAPAYFSPYARRLNRAQHPMQVMALQTGARPAARLCALIGQPVSHSTLLRISRKAPVELHPGPKRVGVDDLPVRRPDSRPAFGHGQKHRQTVLASGQVCASPDV